MVSVLLPLPVVARLGSTRDRPSATRNDRSPLLDTAFHSPAAITALRPPPRQGQCSWPASSMLSRTHRATRSALDSRPQLQSPDAGNDLRPQPVATFHIRNTEPTFRVPLPIRAFTLPDHSARPEFGPGGLPEGQPDSLSLPASVSDLTQISLTAHRSRIATVRPAYCPLNLLEPTQSWSKCVPASNEICRISRAYISIVSSRLQSNNRAIAVHKTNAGENVRESARQLSRCRIWPVSVATHAKSGPRIDSIALVPNAR